MTGRLTFDVREGRPVVRKAALGRSLALEAETLRRAAGPGVVQLVAIEGPEQEPGALVLEAVPGADVATTRPALTEIPRLVASVAATVGRLHETGVAHGNLAPEHVLAGDEGPVLCGFGGAAIRDELDDPAWSAATAADVGDLGRLIDTLTTDAGGDDPLLRHALRRISERATRPAPADRPPAAVLAASLGDLVCADGPIPSAAALEDGLARLRRSAPPSTEGRPGRGRAAAVALASAGVAALVGVPALAGDAPGAPPAVTPATSPATAAAPSASSSTTSTSPAAVRIWPRCDDGCESPQVTFDGIRYVAGEPGDLAVVADAGCDGQADAIVVRPTTGSVFVFARWPAAGEELPARPRTSVPPLVAQLSVAESAGAWGCGHLIVTGPAATETRLPLADLAP